MGKLLGITEQLTGKAAARKTRPYSNSELDLIHDLSNDALITVLSCRQYTLFRPHVYNCCQKLHEFQCSHIKDLQLIEVETKEKRKD